MVVTMAGVGIRRTAGTHAVPCDMNTAIFADGELRSPDCAKCHGGMKLSVDWQWFGKFILAGFAANVENVAAFGVAFEVDEMDNTFCVHGRLRLNAALGRGNEFDGFGE